jgi:hypothetical protein
VAGAIGRQEIRKAMIAAESTVIRRAIEAASKSQQRRLFTSPGRR